MISLADIIIQENVSYLHDLLRSGIEINGIDEYGYTPLIQACIVDNIEIADLLLSAGADVNLQDMTGNTALMWAAGNNNLALSELLLQRGANPNLFNLAGSSALVMPSLRQQKSLKSLLFRYGASEQFAQDYINAKLLGHMFELVGTANIISPADNFVEVDFEGFYLEFSIGIILNSLAQFKNHFAAKQMRRFANLATYIVDVMERAAQLVKYQHYRININKHQKSIDTLIQEEPLIIPIGYEGHAITLIKFDDILVKCDRREESRLYDNVMFYHIKRPEILTPDFIRSLLYERQTDDFINTEIHRLLALQPITELQVEAQISGNCSWANVEACIPSLFFLTLMQYDNSPEQVPHYKSIALNFFHRWREWNKERALHACIRSFHEVDAVRKACKAEILAAILFQACEYGKPSDQERIEAILAILTLPKYRHILQNYIKVYVYESHSEAGQRFANMLKAYGHLRK